MRWGKWIRFETVALLLLAIYPLIPGLDAQLFGITGQPLGYHLTILFIMAILALGLNVVVGYTGLLHLGIAAFFGIGAYLTGIFTVPAYPFQVRFLVAAGIATAGAGVMGVILGAPTLRLRGDYLALVTLGFGEVVRFALRNLEEITAGTKALGPIPPPKMPSWLESAVGAIGFETDWALDYRLFYFTTFAILVGVYLLLRNLENSRMGRAWVAIREDELAATCMGINAARVKLSAFAMGAALAGLAGCLYATKLASTAQPDAYDFNRSIIMLCCIILGGLGSLRGTLLGVLILVGFDNVLAPMLDKFVQDSHVKERVVQWVVEQWPNVSRQTIEMIERLLTFSNWRLFLFGIALILFMRFRPEGLLPSQRLKAEVHEET